MSGEVLDDVLRQQLGSYRTRIDASMAALLAQWEAPEPLADAMRYAVQSGGKRLRPALAIAACEAVGGDGAAAMAPGLALELIHTYSLVHDDLPCMDDDDLRRGKPTVHVAWDEATAILAGDALLTEAFALAARAPGLGADARVAAVCCLARAAGHHGMVGGQVRDIRAKALDADGIRTMHAEKTGALFVAACELGAIAAEADSARSEQLRAFGVELGAAFQVSDDLLDWVEADGQVDEHEQAVNLAALLGPQAARADVAVRVAAGIEALERLDGDTTFLTTLLRWIDARAEAALA